MAIIMNLPNKLTVLRVIMVPFFVVFLLWTDLPYNNYIAGGIFLLASFTDFLDGYIARKYNLITIFGKFMDPLADKMLVCSAMICFLVLPDNIMPVWVVLIIIIREFIISGFRLIAAQKGITIAAGWWGKIKTVVQMIMAIFLIFNFQNDYIKIFEYILIYAAALLTIISLFDYILKNKELLKDID